MTTDTRTTHPNADTADDIETASDAAWVDAGRAWGRNAADWAYRFEPYASDAIEAIFSRLGVTAGVDLLDIACGAGYAASRAERRGAAVAGLDASAELIDIARRRAAGADLVAGDMFALPWADRSFDVATSFNGVWGGCTEALIEARRVLRPNGAIGLTFWGPGHKLDLRDFFIALGSSTPAVADEMISLASIGAPGVVEEMLSVAGFDRIERWAATSILEFADADDAWRTMRSPGLVVPALDHLGEEELRDRLMATIAPFGSPDGSIRIVNELTCVTARTADR
ncbi:MAG: class I SAM-dependent methyltransferase [Ilumatobacter sp.]